MKQTGYTLIELIICAGAVVVLVLVGWIIYAAIHFILKFW